MKVEFACPTSKAATIRPGFQNAPSGLHSYGSTLPVSEKDSNAEGLAHAKVYGLPTKPGYEEKCGSQPTPKPTKECPPDVDCPQESECDPNTADGTLCDTEKREDSAAAAVDRLLKADETDTKEVEDLAREAAALEEALKKTDP